MTDDRPSFLLLHSGDRFLLEDGRPFELESDDESEDDTDG